MLAILFLVFASVSSAVGQTRREPFDPITGQSSLAKVDSIQYENQKSDCLLSHYHMKLYDLEYYARRAQHQIDSLSELELTAKKMRQRLDSIDNLLKGKVVELDAELRTLRDRSIGSLGKLDMPSQIKGTVSNLPSTVEDFSVSSSLETPSIFPSLDPQNYFSDNLSESGLRPSMLDLGDSFRLGDSNNPSITSVKGYSQDASLLVQGNFGEGSELANAAEGKVAELTGLDDIENRLEVLDEYKEIQDPEAVKQQGIRKLQQGALDHFAGKQEALNEAMATMAKYKRSSLTRCAVGRSLKDLFLELDSRYKKRARICW